MAKSYDNVVIQGLAAFKSFGVRAGEYLPYASFDFGVRKHNLGLEPREIADLLKANELVQEIEVGYVLTDAGHELLYGASMGTQEKTAARTVPPSMDKERMKRRDENRYRFLRTLYDVSDGNPLRCVNMWALGKELGLSRDEIYDAVNFLRGEGLLASKTLDGGLAITHAGAREIERTLKDPDTATEHFPVQVINNYYQPVVNQQGSNNTASVGNTSRATVSHSAGAIVAVGPGATAVRERGEDGVVSKEEFVELIEAAQKALVDDQRRLSDDVSDALWDILRRLRHLEFAVASVSQLQQMIKETVDDMAVDSIVAKLKGDEARALGVIRALLESPVTAELVKSWLGG